MSKALKLPQNLWLSKKTVDNRFFEMILHYPVRRKYSASAKNWHIVLWERSFSTCSTQSQALKFWCLRINKTMRQKFALLSVKTHHLGQAPRESRWSWSWSSQNALWWIFKLHTLCACFLGNIQFFKTMQWLTPMTQYILTIFPHLRSTDWFSLLNE